MTTLESLTEKDLKQVLKASSLKRARGYVGRVSDGVRNGRSLRAEVRGSRLYSVEIEVAADDIHAVCSCPYDWGGYCKHIGAVLYRWIESPGSFTIAMPAPADSNTIIETFPIEPPPTAVPKEKPFWISFPYAVRCQKDIQAHHAWMGEYKLQELRQMAKRQGWTLSGNRKTDIIEQIMSHILQPGIALKSLLNLDAEHRQVYDAMGMVYPGIDLMEEHLEPVAAQWGALTKHKRIGTYATHLCEAGLAIPGSFDHHYWRQTTFIPNSLMRVLPPLLADRVPEMSLPEHKESGMILAEQRPFLQRVTQIMILMEQGGNRLRQLMPRPRLEKFYEILQEWDYVPEEIKTAQRNNMFKKHDADFSFTVPPPKPALPDDTIPRLAPIAGDENQLDFIYHLLLAAGLLQPGSPVTVWPEVKKQFLQRDEAAQWAVLARAYFSMDTWSEVWSALAERPSLQLKRSQSSYYRAFRPQDLYETLAVFRGQTLQMLACLPDNCWFSLRDVTELLHPHWLRFDNQAWSSPHYGGRMKPEWFLAENGRMLDTVNNKADWNKAQGDFIQQIIRGPLHWLGMADLSVEYGRLVAFRLHGLGDLFLERTESVPLMGTAALKKDTAVAPQTTSDAITITGTTIVVDPTAVSAQAHNYLDGMAILEEALTNRFVYRLHAAAVHQAFEAGQTLTHMLDDWEKWLSVPMSDAIRSQLSAWWEAYGQVRLYEQVTVIEFGDEYALAEMKAATSLEKHLIAEISPSLAIIPVSAIDLLISELEQAGYTPKKTDKVE